MGDYVPGNTTSARRVVARYLKLQPGNVIHHDDRNGKNNDPPNLRVFSCGRDHILYHRGHHVVPIWDGREPGPELPIDPGLAKLPTFVWGFTLERFYEVVRAAGG